jgi:hypothetical protein
MNKVALIFFTIAFPVFSDGIDKLDIRNYTSIKPSDVRKLSTTELTILRSSIYAHHGYIFKQKWLQDYFATKDWYKENKDYNYSNLTPEEFKNADFLQETIEAMHPRIPSDLKYRAYKNLDQFEAFPYEWISLIKEKQKDNPQVINLIPDYKNLKVNQMIDTKCSSSEIENDTCVDIALASRDSNSDWAPKFPVYIAGFQKEKIRYFRKAYYGASIYPGDIYLFDENNVLTAIFGDNNGTTCGTSIFFNYYKNILVSIDYTRYCNGELIGKEKIYK